LTENLAKLTNLTRLDLSNNPLVCDCLMIDFIALVKGSGDKTIKAKCNSGVELVSLDMTHEKCREQERMLKEANQLSPDLQPLNHHDEQTIPETSPTFKTPPRLAIYGLILLLVGVIMIVAIIYVRKHFNNSRGLLEESNYGPTQGR